MDTTSHKNSIFTRMDSQTRHPVSDAECQMPVCLNSTSAPTVVAVIQSAVVGMIQVLQ
jgi:hypothetical protein